MTTYEWCHVKAYIHLPLARPERLELPTLCLAYPLQFSLPPYGVCGLDFLFTIELSFFRCSPLSLYTFPFLGFARDHHLTDFPDFEEFYSQGFP